MAKHYGVRTSRYKLIHYYRVGEWELFDLESDPQEMQSVYGREAYAAITANLKAEIVRLRARVVFLEAELASKTPPPIITIGDRVLLQSGATSRGSGAPTPAAWSTWPRPTTPRPRAA